MQTRLPLILGLGISGFSVVRYFMQRDIVPIVIDTRSHPPALDMCRRDFPHVPFFVADEFHFQAYPIDSVCISPGFVLNHKLIDYAQRHNIPIGNDVDIFATHCNATIVAVTGTNGKTTICTMLGHVLQKAGIKVCVAGNIGLPVADLLANTQDFPKSDVYILELSSFQLHWQNSLQGHTGVLANIAEDHLNIHGTFAHYVQAKQKIYQGAKLQVYNLDDSYTVPVKPVNNTQMYGFCLSRSMNRCRRDAVLSNEHIAHIDQNMLCLGKKHILPLASLPSSIEHNQYNALACIAALATIGQEESAQHLASYTYLPHRCQYIGMVDGVGFINDSKATNPHAAVHALLSLHKRWCGVVVIAGGDAKGSDCRFFAQVLQKYCKAAVLMGKDKEYLASLVAPMSCVLVADLPEALHQAQRYAQDGDCIVLSPGCASTDMFKDYCERGDIFMELVTKLRSTSMQKSTQAMHTTTQSHVGYNDNA